MSRFSVDDFCLRVSKNFAAETFCFSQNFWCGKTFMDQRGGGGGEIVNNFLLKVLFISQCR